MMHLHVRDRHGRHTLDPDIYRYTIGSIRKAVGDRLIIQATSEAAGRYKAEQQMQAIRALKPEAVSLALREFIPQPSMEKTAAGYFDWLRHNACVPQYILYSAKELNWYLDLFQREIIPHAPHWVLLVLGRYNKTQQSHSMDLVEFLTTLKDNPIQVPWAMCAFGSEEYMCAMSAATFGGHIRVGFENNVYLKDGSLAADNQSSVDQIKQGVKVLNRPLMTGPELREFLQQGFD